MILCSSSVGMVAGVGGAGRAGPAFGGFSDGGFGLEEADLAFDMGMNLKEPLTYPPFLGEGRPLLRATF